MCYTDGVLFIAAIQPLQALSYDLITQWPTTATIDNTMPRSPNGKRAPLSLAEVNAVYTPCLKKTSTYYFWANL